MSTDLVYMPSGTVCLTGQSLQTVDLCGVLSFTDEPSVKLQAVEAGYW